jgi:integrase
VGGYILTMEPLFSGRPATWYHYTYSLRKIAYEIANGQQESDASKFDPFNKPWQKEADKIKLSVVTSQAIHVWKQDCKERAGQDEIEQLKAKRNINSFMKSARILFGKKMMCLLDQNHLEKPLSNPFEGVILEDEGSKKYTSKFNASELLQEAEKDLAEADPEAWKTIWLGQGAGLRRAEIDNLCKNHIDYSRLGIRVTNTPFFRTKTDSSEGFVHVDESMLDELKKHLNGNGPFVIDSEVPPTSRKSRRHYRCQDTFERVVKWLRAHGVDEVKPLQTLRKEFGSIINAQSDIHTACGQLRHSNIRTTSDIYADNRRISTVPMGAMLHGKSTKGAKGRKAK